VDTTLFMALIKGDKEIFQQLRDERHKKTQLAANAVDVKAIN